MTEQKMEAWIIFFKKQCYLKITFLSTPQVSNLVNRQVTWLAKMCLVTTQRTKNAVVPWKDTHFRFLIAL